MSDRSSLLVGFRKHSKNMDTVVTMHFDDIVHGFFLIFFISKLLCNVELIIPTPPPTRRYIVVIMYTRFLMVRSHFYDGLQ